MNLRSPGRRRLLGYAALTPAVTHAALALAQQPPATARPLAAAAARALALRDEAVRRGDQPYGAVVVKDGRIVGEGISAVVTSRDPAAHAERVAIADAMSRLASADLSGCVLVGSSRACAACTDAAYRARIDRLYHGPQPSDDGVPRPSF